MLSFFLRNFYKNVGFLIYNEHFCDELLKIFCVTYWDTITKISCTFLPAVTIHDDSSLIKAIVIIAHTKTFICLYKLCETASKRFLHLIYVFMYSSLNNAYTGLHKPTALYSSIESQLNWFAGRSFDCRIVYVAI